MKVIGKARTLKRARWLRGSVRVVARGGGGGGGVGVCVWEEGADAVDVSRAGAQFVKSRRVAEVIAVWPSTVFVDWTASGESDDAPDDACDPAELRFIDRFAGAGGGCQSARYSRRR